MEEKHRQKITQCMQHLVKETNFEVIFSLLVESRLFSPYMQNEILAQEDLSERITFMYEYVKTRGPHAFNTLVYTLYKSGHVSLARMLDYKILRDCDKVTDCPVYPKIFITKAINRMDHVNPQYVYKMGSRPKGIALIINIRTFVNNCEDERFGSEYDVQQLQNLMMQLDYKVIMKHELTKSAFEKEIQNFRDLEEHSLYDSCIVIIMSHGLEMDRSLFVRAHDMGIVAVEWIIEQFSVMNCRQLSGKPKLFFFQMCRGDTRDYGHTIAMNHTQSELITESGAQMTTESTAVSLPNSTTQTDGKLEAKPGSFVRNVSDMIIVNACAPGYVACREPNWGSWFIQTLCEVIMENAWEHELTEMLRMVDQKVEQFPHEIGSPYSQTTCWESRGAYKKFYFHPGLYDD